jgi:hypothetical protein
MLHAIKAYSAKNLKSPSCFVLKETGEVESRSKKGNAITNRSDNADL